METTSVIAVLNVMAFTNVDPSNTLKQGNRSQSKVLSCSTKAVIYLITCPCGKNDVGGTKSELTRCTQLRPTFWKRTTLFRPFAISTSNTSPRRGGDLDNLLLKGGAA
jgi:hypothetical protein